jgi:hypothetical protein
VSAAFRQNVSREYARCISCRQIRPVAVAVSAHPSVLTRERSRGAKWCAECWTRWSAEAEAIKQEADRKNRELLERVMKEQNEYETTERKGDGR